MKQKEKLKELFEKIKNETTTNKSELDEAVEKMGQQEFCDWVDETLRIIKEEKEGGLPPEV